MKIYYSNFKIALPIIIASYLILFHSGCNKYSRELPPIYSYQDSFTIQKYLDGNQLLLQAKYYMYTTENKNSFSVEFQNLSDKILENYRIIIESNNNSPSFNNSKIIFNQTISLNGNANSIKLPIYLDEEVFRNKNLTLYIVDREGENKNLLCGFYTNINSWFGSDTNIIDYCQVYSLIEIDGTTIMRIKTNSETFYNIESAYFVNSLYFSGKLYQDKNAISDLSLNAAYSAMTTVDSTTFNLSLSNPLQNGSNQINLNLRKQ